MRLLFLPPKFQRVRVLVWLKRVHAWTGFWGAALFLLLGVSGIALNHRTVMKIDTGPPVEQSEIAIPVEPSLIRSEKALGEWAQRQFHTETEPRPVDGGPKSAGRDAVFLGQKHPTRPFWRMALHFPNGQVTVTYAPGNAVVLVKQETSGFWATLKGLHKGTGQGVAWVLLFDSIAGALVAMALTGFFLWSRLHGPRLLAGGIIATSVGAAIAAAWPHFLQG